MTRGMSGTACLAVTVVRRGRWDTARAVSVRLGDKKSAAEAVNAVLETIQSAVAAGRSSAVTSGRGACAARSG